MTQIARRVGWKNRRHLHVIDAKAPVPDTPPDPWWELVDDDYSCDCDCCVNSDWAVYVMPPMIFGVDGLVHVSRPKNPTAVCGEEGNWPVPSVGSTDEAIAYANKYAGDFRQITCLRCISSAHYYDITWRSP